MFLSKDLEIKINKNINCTITHIMKLQWKLIELIVDFMRTIKVHNIKIYHEIKTETVQFWKMRKIID